MGAPTLVEKRNVGDVEHDGAEVFLDAAPENERTRTGEEGAETLVGFREEGGLVEGGGVLETDELHRLFVFGGGHFRGDEPADGGDGPADVSR